MEYSCICATDLSKLVKLEVVRVVKLSRDYPASLPGRFPRRRHGRHRHSQLQRMLRWGPASIVVVLVFEVSNVSLRILQMVKQISSHYGTVYVLSENVDGHPKVISELYEYELPHSPYSIERVVVSVCLENLILF